jgi:hypothetical protein
MIPEEFVEFSLRFETGFLAWIIDNKPTMQRTDFSISKDNVIIEPTEYDTLRLPGEGEKVTLIFANQWYTERCEMGVVSGVLEREGQTLKLEPHKITWSLSFDINEYPEKIVKRWRKK